MLSSKHLRPGPFAFCYSFVVFLSGLPGLSPAFAQLNGTYTLGSAGDYASFTEAATALETEGISGPVTFNVQPGTYQERVEINNVPGSSCEVSIVFAGETGSPGRVTLQAPDASAFTVKVDRVAGVGFRNINMLGASPVVTVAPGTDCFSLENNVLSGPASGPLVYAPSTRALRSNNHR